MATSFNARSRLSMRSSRCADEPRLFLRIKFFGRLRPGGYLRQGLGILEVSKDRD